MKGYIVTCIFAISTIAMLGQRTPDRVTRADSNRVYTDLKKALASEKPVFRLDLTRKRLRKIPPEIFEFTELRELTLNRNRIAEVPAEIAKLTKLEVLSMSRNRLKEFPPAICNLRALITLDLSDNELSRIPDEIHRLENLEELILWSNMIAYFPGSMMRMNRLRLVDLLNNEMNMYEHDRLRGLLPDAELVLSPPCNCIFDDDDE